MPFLTDEPITNYFHRISPSSGKNAGLRKRKRPEEGTENKRASSANGKKPKVQQKLVFSGASPDKPGSSKPTPTRVTVKAPLQKKLSTSLQQRSATPTDEEDLRVSSPDIPETRLKNTIPTLASNKRPVTTQSTRSFLIPRRTSTPIPSSSRSFDSLLPSTSRNTSFLPTPVTMPRRITYCKVQVSPPRRSPSPSSSPQNHESSPEPSEESSLYPLGSEYSESIGFEQGQQQGQPFHRSPSPPPPPSQNFVPSSQPQADGAFDNKATLSESAPGTPNSYSSLDYHEPQLGKTGYTVGADDEQGYVASSQSQDVLIFSSKNSSRTGTAETSRIEINDGREVVLSSQSQLVLPFHISPRKKRKKTSHSSTSSFTDSISLSGEVIPSSQSQVEKELDITSKLFDDRAPTPIDDSLDVGTSPSNLNHWHTSASFSSQASSSSPRILVNETQADFHDISAKDDGQGSATEEESGDEGINPFASLERTPSFVQETALLQPLLSQESKEYPSSLPDAIKEFREMFGDGDGSYPDDFPMSLR
ncbi:hypothetical protein H0H92_014380 [Tricholoma furcatifolium]|nr:hypothetical protein H0H92_014380 [Tricholoma furcatifolium]